MATTPTHAILHISGTDAGTFLRAQLTIDVQRLNEARHGLAAWCDAKGRTLCILRVVPVDDGFLTILPADLADTISKRLRMYVLRARVQITDVSTQWNLAGLVADDTQALPANGTAVAADDGHVLSVDTGNGPGAICLRRGAGADTDLALDDPRWQLAAVDAGLPQVLAATSGLFVPQMLNLHRLGGIEFDKGCYPGQEVVARLHYRGRLTRHMMRLAWQGTTQPTPGDDVTSADGTRQGTVVRSAPGAPNSGRLLAVLRTDAARQALVSNQAELELLDLPYAMRDDTAINA